MLRVPRRNAIYLVVVVTKHNVRAVFPDFKPLAFRTIPHEMKPHVTAIVKKVNLPYQTKAKQNVIVRIPLHIMIPTHCIHRTYGIQAFPERQEETQHFPASHVRFIPAYQVAKEHYPRRLAPFHYPFYLVQYPTAIRQVVFMLESPHSCETSTPFTGENAPAYKHYTITLQKCQQLLLNSLRKQTAFKVARYEYLIRLWTLSMPTEPKNPFL